jgi:ABC-type oligopeptide transport system substrate-binding subunit
MLNIRLALFALSLMALSLVICHAQTTSDGRVEGNTYVNSYFKLAYSWPKSLQPADASKLNLPNVVPNPNESLLFSARQGTEPFGVVVIAEKLGVSTQRSRGTKDGSDFLDRVTVSSGLTKERILKRTTLTNEYGLTFQELDYLLDGGYSSAITIQVGQWLMAFRCNAKSESDLLVMTKSVLSSRPGV